MAALALPDDWPLLWSAVFHLALLAVLFVGAIFDDALARVLRLGGGLLMLMACLAAVFDWGAHLAGLPSWAVALYPPLVAVLLAGYGRVLRDREPLALAGLGLVCWLAVSACRGYVSLRQTVTGLDYIALSLALFGLAILVSLGKAGVLSRWLAERAGKVSYPGDS